ncbi:MAG: ABC transporter substrate-binding protein [Dehalococcoidia bacterium]|nr:ABC transporter substrate-binding protein [Dehalococcoidia bacterium]
MNNLSMALVFVFMVSLFSAACVSPPVSTSAPSGQPAPAAAPATSTQSQESLNAMYARSPYIVEPTNFAWPRTVKDWSGQTIVIKEKPQRIVMLSLGFEETSLALVAPERIAAVSTFVAEPYSNIADVASGIKARVTRDPETILALRPDLVITYHLTKPELMKQLRDAGLTVVQIDGGEKLLDPAYGFVPQVLTLAYIYGEDQRGAVLVSQMQEHLDLLGKQAAADGTKPRVLYFSGKYMAGADTNLDWIIRAAGGINVAAEAGVNKWQPVSEEAIIKLAPDYIMFSNEYEDKTLATNPNLASVPAIKARQLVGVPDRYLSTLSPWNIRGVEELAKAIHPKAFSGITVAPFNPAR